MSPGKHYQQIYLPAKDKPNSIPFLKFNTWTQHIFGFAGWPSSLCNVGTALHKTGRGDDEEMMPNSCINMFQSAHGCNFYLLRISLQRN